MTGRTPDETGGRRRFVPPLGWPMRWRALTVTPADRPPLLMLNRYPRQAIGFGMRLPDARGKHRQLSLRLGAR